MNDDSILFAIDDAAGASTLCACGKELRVTQHDGTVWLECPAYAGPTLFPARLAFFFREATHDRRPVGALPTAPTRATAGVSHPASVARPVAVNG
jgi:hypothetical protein